MSYLKRLTERIFPVRTNDAMKGFNMIVVAIFFTTLLTKIFGLCPYKYRGMTLFYTSFSVSLIVWGAINLSRLFWNVTVYFSHLTPEGTPGLLNPLLNLIELRRKLIRSFTLSLRITINITTGHVLMTLLRSSTVGLLIRGSIFFPGILLAVQTGYFLFEFGVCFLQAYVFSLLLYQYLGEHPK